jgi:hypothetical protein
MRILLPPFRPVSLLTLVLLLHPSAAVAQGTEPAHAVGHDSLLFRNEHLMDWTGDGQAERMVLEGIGADWLSARIRFRILSPQDSLLYADDWTALFYFHYSRTDPFRLSPDGREAAVRERTDPFFDPGAFGHGETWGYGRITEQDMAEAIGWDLREQYWRNRYGHPRTAHLSFPEYRQRQEELGPIPARARIDEVIREVKGRPSFEYYAGGEVRYVIAYCPSEGRFIRIASCC